MHRYDDVLTTDLRVEVAVWRAANGVKPEDRTLPGPPPTDDREAAYHQSIIRTINARYGEALKAWETRIIECVGRRDEHTFDLAKYLDQLQRRGVDAEQLLDRAAGRKPLPDDHPTAALTYRVRELVAPLRTRRSGTGDVDPFVRRPQQPPHQPQRPSGPSLGL